MSDLSIPGFMTPPDHPNLDERFFSEPDGTVDVMLKIIPSTTPTPDYVIYLSKDAGTRVNLLDTLPRGDFILRDKGDDEMDTLRLYFKTDTLQLFPDTYRLRVLENGQEVLSMSLTARDHPTIIRW